MNTPPPPPIKELRCGCVIDAIVYEQTKDTTTPAIIPLKVCDKHSTTALTAADLGAGLPWMYIGIALLLVLSAVAFYYYGGDMKFITDSVKSVSEAVTDAAPKVSA